MSMKRIVFSYLAQTSSDGDIIGDVDFVWRPYKSELMDRCREDLAKRIGAAAAKGANITVHRWPRNRGSVNLAKLVIKSEKALKKATIAHALLKHEMANRYRGRNPGQSLMAAAAR